MQIKTAATVAILLLSFLNPYPSWAAPPTGTTFEIEPPYRYAINLESALEPIDLSSLPRNDALIHYRLYTTRTVKNGKVWYRARLGFFPTKQAAEEVLESLGSSFPQAWVTSVDEIASERIMESGTGVPTWTPPVAKAKVKTAPVQEPEASPAEAAAETIVEVSPLAAPVEPVLDSPEPPSVEPVPTPAASPEPSDLPAAEVPATTAQAKQDFAETSYDERQKSSPTAKRTLKPYSRMGFGGGGAHLPGGDSIGLGFLNLTGFLPVTKKVEFFGGGLFRQIEDGSQYGGKLGVRFRLPALRQIHSLGATLLRSEEHENFVILNLKSKKNFGGKALVRFRYDQPLTDRKLIERTIIGDSIFPVYQRVGNFLGLDVVLFPGTKHALRAGISVTDLFGPDSDADEGSTFAGSAGYDIKLGANTVWNVLGATVDENGDWAAGTGITMTPGNPSDTMSDHTFDDPGGVGEIGGSEDPPTTSAVPPPSVPKEEKGVEILSVGDLFCVTSQATGQVVCVPR
jgi:hypothetical protein